MLAQRDLADDASSDYRQFPACPTISQIETNKTLATFTALPCATGQRSSLAGLLQSTLWQRLAKASAPTCRASWPRWIRLQAVIEFDLQGHVLKANDNFLRTMGYSARDNHGPAPPHVCR